MRQILLRTDTTNALPCKICGGDAYLYDVVDFNKFCTRENYYQYGLSGIPLYYRKCQNCDLVFTASLDKLDVQDFADCIYNDDYINFDPDYVEKRPAENADFLIRLLTPIKSHVKGLDYGGGNGLTARLLAQDNWNFHSCDPISNPIPPSTSFSGFNVISAIEVFEHLPRPKSALEDILRYAASHCLLVVGTLASDGQLTKNRLDWWYAGPRNGHVTLYSKKSLSLLFAQFGFSYYSPHDSLHLGIRGNPQDSKLVQVVQSMQPAPPRPFRERLKRFLLRRIRFRD